MDEAGKGKEMRYFIWVFALAIIFTATNDVQAENSGKAPYVSNIEDYPSDWKPRHFDCTRFDFIPYFTLEYYSNPNKDELEELCNCIAQNIRHEWVRDTGRKFKKGEEVTDFMYKRAFPIRFGEKIRICTKGK